MTITARLVVSTAVEHRRDALAGQHDIESLLRAHHGLVVRACRRLLRDKAAAADIAQDVMLIAWRRREHYRCEGSFKAWVCGIARFVCWRANAKKADWLTHDGNADLLSTAPSQLDNAVRQELRLVLANALRELKPDVRQAVTLRFLDDLDPRDINRIMGLTNRSGCRGMLYRGLKQLRVILSDSSC